VRKQSSIFKLTFLFSVPLLIMVAFAAGIKEFYWIAIVFMEVWFFIYNCNVRQHIFLPRHPET
jgi:hypothetical protein